MRTWLYTLSDAVTLVDCRSVAHGPRANSTLAMRGRACRYMRAPAPWSKLVAKGRLAASGRGASRASASAPHSRSAAAGQAAGAGAASATQPGANSAADTPAHRPAAVSQSRLGRGSSGQMLEPGALHERCLPSTAGRQLRERVRSAQEVGHTEKILE